MHDPPSSPDPSKPCRKKSLRISMRAFSFEPNFALTYSSTPGYLEDRSRLSSTEMMGFTIRVTCVYLSIKTSALGTSRSPRWITEDPTQHPIACFASLRQRWAPSLVLGAPSMRWWPCPVLTKRYRAPASSRSSSTLCHSDIMSRCMIVHSVSVSLTNWYCVPWSCDRHEPSLPARMRKLYSPSARNSSSHSNSLRNDTVLWWTDWRASSMDRMQRSITATFSGVSLPCRAPSSRIRVSFSAASLSGLTAASRSGSRRRSSAPMSLSAVFTVHTGVMTWAPEASVVDTIERLPRPCAASMSTHIIFPYSLRILFGFILL
eukprot:PhM_4_TR7132/c0_g1_i1/m.89824